LREPHDEADNYLGDIPLRSSLPLPPSASGRIRDRRRGRSWTEMPSLPFRGRFRNDRYKFNKLVTEVLSGMFLGWNPFCRSGFSLQFTDPAIGKGIP
jgi:hypothetical protein